MKSREVQLVRRPEGMRPPDDFAVAETSVRDPAPGEALVQNVLMSVDPYLRLHLAQAQTLGARLTGGGLGRVLASRGPGRPEGQLVRHRQGFGQRFVCPAAALTPLAADCALRRPRGRPPRRRARRGAPASIGLPRP